MPFAWARRNPSYGPPPLAFIASTMRLARRRCGQGHLNDQTRANARFGSHVNFTALNRPLTLRDSSDRNPRVRLNASMRRMRYCGTPLRRILYDLDVGIAIQLEARTPALSLVHGTSVDSISHGTLYHSWECNPWGTPWKP